MKSNFCPGPFSRRSFLQFGGLTMLGMNLVDSLKLKAALSETPKVTRNDTSVIFIWLPGGPPHMETYDMKPDAPMEYRGIFKPIKTNVSGIEICELLPLQAKIADKFNIIRSVSHDFSDHGGGAKRVMTGRIPASPAGTVNDAPSVSSIVYKCMTEGGGFKNGMPPVVIGQQGSGIHANANGPAYLGGANAPFIVTGDPSNRNFKVQNLGVSREMETRLDDRMALMKGLDQFRRERDQSGVLSAMDSFNQHAFEMLTSSKVRDAFDLSKESPRVRDRYGMHAYGQRALMARRLVEAECRFVEMVWDDPYPGRPVPTDCAVNWDSHGVNCNIFSDSRWRMPPYDQAVSALIEDLVSRGLDQKTMLIVSGEFGRTPKISNEVGTKTKVTQPGRDHWPKAMSMIMAGGGMRTGQIIGATNSRGEYPVERPLTPNDIWATVYQHLGIDWTASFPDLTGRPMPILPFGDPIEELLPSKPA